MADDNVLFNPTQMDRPGRVEVSEVTLPDLDTVASNAAAPEPEPERRSGGFPTARDLGPSADGSGLPNLNSGNILPTEAQPSSSPRILTQREIQKKKSEYITRFRRRQQKGRPPSRAFDISDSLEDMEAEDRAMKSDDNFAFFLTILQQMHVAVNQGIEVTANAFPKLGMNLRGLSQNAYESMDDVDPIFEEILEDWGDMGQMSPYMKYVLCVARGVYMTHTMNKMSSAMPGADVVLNKNPELKNAILMAMAKEQASQAQAPPPQAQAASMFGGGFNPLGFFAGPPGQLQTPPAPTPSKIPSATSYAKEKAARQEIRGPPPLEESLFRQIPILSPNDAAVTQRKQRRDSIHSSTSRSKNVLNFEM